jgi:hypothetical protein
MAAYGKSQVDSFGICYTNYMQQLLEGISGKKLVIILVIIGLALLGFALFSLLNINGNGVSNTARKDGNSTSTSGKSYKDSSGKIIFPDMASYQTQYYSLRYPQFYDATKDKKADGVLDSTTFKDPSGSTVIHVTVYDKKVRSLTSLRQPYYNEEYNVESFPVSAGTLYHFDKLTPTSDSRKEKIAFLEKEGAIIQFSLSYATEDVDMKIESDFAKLVSSMD